MNLLILECDSQADCSSGVASTVCGTENCPYDTTLNCCRPPCDGTLVSNCCGTDDDEYSYGPCQLAILRWLLILISSRNNHIIMSIIFNFPLLLCIRMRGIAMGKKTAQGHLFVAEEPACSWDPDDEEDCCVEECRESFHSNHGLPHCQRSKIITGR